MGGKLTKCCTTQTPYARYQSNNVKIENELNLENVLGSLLEMDPSLQDREEGITKINNWIDEISAEIKMNGPQLEISRWKCIKYWESQHVSDVYGKGRELAASKLTGSCVRFFFENPNQPDITPRLVIEHCGKSLQVNSERRSSKATVPMWIKNLKNLSKSPFHRRSERQESFISANDTTEMLSTRYG